MGNDDSTPRTEFDRRDFIVGSAGVAALAVGPGGATAALAQAGPGPASGSPSSLPPPAPGSVGVERRGAVLMVGLDLAQAQDRLTPPAIIGLGKAYHQLEQDDGLRVAALHSIGLNFCAGLDVPAFAAAQAAGILPPKDPDFINPLGLRPPIRTKPVVVAVQGRAMSVGDELVLAADIRVAGAGCRFWSTRGHPGRVSGWRRYGPADTGGRLGQCDVPYADRRGVERERGLPPRPCAGGDATGKAARSSY
jgi:Enoyl-CoA hydratase/isomerase